jgi:decaprenyl-phosphate phosphoribosyltransferase
VSSPALRLLRPEQWIKNLLVLAPWVFAGLSHDRDSGVRALLAAIVFTIASAGVYVFNDYVDRHRDQAHAVKKNTRPIAAGEVSSRAALFMIALLAAILAAGIFLLPAIRVPVLGFIALNAAYSLWLKHIPVIDLLAVSAGYLLRVYAGALAVGVPLSSWMALATVCLSLFLVSSKRYAEITSGAAAARQVLAAYSPRFLNVFHWVAGGATILCYTAYVIVVQPAIISTVPIVALGLARYAWLAGSVRRSESPGEVLSRDWPLLASVLVWAGICILLIERP